MQTDRIDQSGLIHPVGMGSKRNRDDDWIERHDAFDKMLAELNAVQGNPQGVTLAPGGPTTPSQGKTLVEKATEAKKIV